MKPQFILLAAIGATCLYAVAAPSSPLPDPWILSGKAPQMYEAGIDESAVGGTKGAKFIRMAKGDGKQWASLTQQFSAEDYRGKRLRFQARVKTADVSRWAGLWMRIDTPSHPNAAFYNSQDRPIAGSTGWQVRDVVLDVPADASVVSFGVINEGRGEVWIDALKFEVVDAGVPVNVMLQRSAYARTPSL
jgi:hypothetical protein